MKLNSKALLLAAGLVGLSCSQGFAKEALVAAQSKPGALIGASAGVPPPGIYMFNQVFTYQTNLTGPGTAALGIGNHNAVAAAVDIQGFLFVPGWTFLGATYDALIVQPFSTSSVGSPSNVQDAGMHDTLLIPVELSWKLADSGFAVKTGLSIFTPDGTVTGPYGTGTAGSPYWTYQPEVV